MGSIIFIYEKQPETFIKNAINQASSRIKTEFAKEYLITQLPEDRVNMLRADKSFDEDDLLVILRSLYDITIHVPDYRPVEMLAKSSRLWNTRKIAIRP